MGEKIDPQRLSITAREEHDVNITVTGPEGDLYHAKGQIRNPPFATRETIAIGRPGNYTVKATIDGKKFEETWQVENGFRGFSINLDEPELRNEERSATVALTRVSGTPPEVTPSPFEKVSNIKPLLIALDRLEKCSEDDTHDYCVYDNIEDRELLTATHEVSGREYSEASALRNRLPHMESPVDGYPAGYYFRNSRQVYRVILDETRGPPVY
jgi:hypothetical protein